MPEKGYTAAKGNLLERITSVAADADEAAFLGDKQEEKEFLKKLRRLEVQAHKMGISDELVNQASLRGSLKTAIEEGLKKDEDFYRELLRLH
jgi:hypothetical protein